VNKKRVLISGAGVAGIVCALALDKEKYDIEFVEKADSFRNIGFSIVLWKSGFELLRSLFLARDHVLHTNKDDYAVDKFVMFGGLKIKRLREFDARGFAWVFERQHLMEMLEAELAKTFPASAIRFGKTISDIRIKDGAPARVTFSDNSDAEYDLVIIAEGIYSMTRPLLFEERIISLPWRLLYGWFAKETNFLDHAGLFFTKGYVAVIHPPHVHNLLGFYFKKGAVEEDEHAFEKRVLQFVKGIRGEEISFDVKTSKLFDLREVHLDSYSKGNVVAIGDAAHGRPPTVGFGTTLAIEDALALARALNKLAPKDFAAQVAPRLASFSRVRSKRVEQIYRLQRLVHQCITDDALKVSLIAALSPIISRYFERKIKHFALYKLPGSI